MKAPDQHELANIERKLDTLIRLVAMALASDNHSVQEKAVRLQRAGLPPRDIAVLCGSTPNATFRARRRCRSSTRAWAGLDPPRWMGEAPRGKEGIFARYASGRRRAKRAEGVWARP